jgi:DNA-binding CsgD family transcriptional regulator
VVDALLGEYWKWQGQRFQARLDEREPVEAAFGSFGQEALTQREREIVRLLLAGHSTKSAARELDISDGTVKVHRKHIYQRLEVSSQSQLFRLFLDHVALVSRQQGG